MNDPLRHSLRDALNRRLSGIGERPDTLFRVLQQANSQRRRKKPFHAVLAFALAAALLVAGGLAAGIGRSPEYSALEAARSAVMEAYGLTPEMIKIFAWRIDREGETTVVTLAPYEYASNYVNDQAIGVYTVRLKGNTASASWSHDGADPALWQAGGLDSPVWGAPQLAQTLERYAADVRAQIDAWAAQSAGMDMPPEQTDWMGDAAGLPEGWSFEAPEGRIPVAQATAIAREAMQTAYALTGEQLAAYLVEAYYIAAQDVWNVIFYGVEAMGSVVLRAADGEIQMVHLDSPLYGNG